MKYVMSRTHIGQTQPPDLSLHYDLGDAGGKKVCVTQNPDTLSGKALGPFKDAQGKIPQFTGQCTISCQPDGSLEARPGVVVADFELPAIDGAFSVTFWPGQGGIGPNETKGTCYKFLGAIVPENK